MKCKSERNHLGKQVTILKAWLWHFPPSICLISLLVKRLYMISKSYLASTSDIWHPFRSLAVDEYISAIEYAALHISKTCTSRRTLLKNTIQPRSQDLFLRFRGGKGPGNEDEHHWPIIDWNIFACLAEMSYKIKLSHNSFTNRN